MNRDGKKYLKNRTKQKYSCPFKYSRDDNACSRRYERYFNGKKYRGCIKYSTVTNDYRASIDRKSIHFKSVYALRTEIERYNSRFKATGTERLWVRNFNSTRNINTIAHIALLTIAFSAVITKKNISYRCNKSLKRVS